ncbi:hypothetical protein J7T55_000241 [Diaporthe amygdali]|uniref:uncharacterized protein n=1 Tax=Phomopsis amygdali TaxID=1214568 RepID=UPI0022FF3C30|nr:uncharacterized protein J7T55_000241 [Diaporthe amygdali]KAJ0103732.1 hypothetical protein J7T55_000241 [Diaporthe amygdali]
MADSSSADQGAGQGGSSGAAALTQSKNYWPLFASKVRDELRWLPIKFECHLYGCDFADIEFHCEIYCELENKDATEDQLLDVGQSSMYKCPKALAALEKT